MRTIDVDVAVIGAGPAGLAAAVKVRDEGIKNLVVLEREDRPGGILKQCIHNGFGLEKFDAELTGPEYAARYVSMAEQRGIDIELGATVLEMNERRELQVAAGSGGVATYRCKTVVLAMGCRERPRGAIDLPGTRPAGIFTAGHAQKLINIEGYMPGREVVILGSGDIGMIMARRLTLEGARVKAVVEILPYTSGLIRNEVQCLHDFGIPLLLGHTISDIHGTYRVEGVTVSKVDERWNYVPGSETIFGCDTLLLSVGLIPENELTRGAGVRIDPRTGGPVVDELLETSVPGIFSCGNVLHVNDLVDNVSGEGEVAALGVAGRVRESGIRSERSIALETDGSIGQITPHFAGGLRDVTVSLRVKKPMGRMKLHVGDGYRKSFPYARPGEMIRIKVPKKVFQEMDNRQSSLLLRCEERDDAEQTD